MTMVAVVAVAGMMEAIEARATAIVAVAVMATVMAAVTVVTMVVVVGTKTTAAAAMVGGTDNIQLNGAVEEMMVAATVTRIGTVMATEMGRFTVTTMTPMPTTLHQQLQQGQHSRCLKAYLQYLVFWDVLSRFIFDANLLLYF